MTSPLFGNMFCDKSLGNQRLSSMLLLDPLVTAIIILAYHLFLPNKWKSTKESVIQCTVFMLLIYLFLSIHLF